MLKQNKILLENHSLLVTNTIQSVDDLRVFMEHHVYAVWDFMCLVKALQHSICPSGPLWMPSRLQRSCARFINEIIVAEESDVDPVDGRYISHFDLYCQAMLEVGADIKPIIEFLKTVEQKGIQYALAVCKIPEPSRQFMKKTFEIIERNNPHEIGAAFAHGRETVIPSMFRRLTTQLGLNLLNAPRFLYYLERHITVDGEDHGPAAIAMLDELYEFDPIKTLEAEQVAIAAIKARIMLWNQVEDAISNV